MNKGMKNLEEKMGGETLQEFCWVLRAVLGTRVGRLLATGVGAVLGKSEQLLDRYCPGTAKEPAPAEGVEVTLGVEVTSGSEVAVSGRQSCFVGSLPAKLWPRTLRRSLGDLQRARHRARRLLARLHRAIQLGTAGPRKLCPWDSGHGPGAARGTPGTGPSGQGGAIECPEVDARTLAVLRGLLQQLRAACSPGSVREAAGRVRAALASARSLPELPGLALALARGRGSVARARRGGRGLLERLGQRTPLPWLVGPFAPALVEWPEDVPVEMAKWQGCVTVRGTHRVPAAPRVCSQR